MVLANALEPLLVSAKPPARSIDDDDDDDQRRQSAVALIPLNKSVVNGGRRAFGGFSVPIPPNAVAVPAPLPCEHPHPYTTKRH